MQVNTQTKNFHLRKEDLEDNIITRIDGDTTRHYKPKRIEKTDSLLRVPVIDLVIYKAKLLGIAAIRAA